jgi:uncharacterized protein YecE (DUF72 family)
MKIYAGTSGFAHKEWKGKFYPEKISPKELLRFYAERLGTVEINNTFYHMPKESVLASWAEQVPDDFVFALKAPQVITHIRQLRNVFEQTEYLFKSVSILGRKLGPILFQFPKSFRANAPALKDFLPLIPGNIPCAFDFRSQSWLEGGIPDLLRDKGCSWCNEDTDENPANKIISTAAWGYLRLRRSDYTDADMSEWVEKIFKQKWEKTFVYFKHEDEAKGAELAMRFQERIDSRLNGGKVKAGRVNSAAKAT